MPRRRAHTLYRAALLVGVACALGVAAPVAPAAVIGFDDQPASTVLGEQYASTGVHIGPSPFAGQSDALTVVARPAQARSGPNVAALSYDAQTDFSSGWIRFDKPQSTVSFYACRTGGAGDPPQPNVNVDAYDAGGTLIDNQQGIPCTLNGPLIPITVQKPGVSFIHVAGTGGSAPPGPGWAIDDLEYATDPPPAVVPPTTVPPVVAPPAQSGSAAVTSLMSAAPAVAGSTALLKAGVVGQVERLDWDVTGDGRTDVSCPGAQSTLSFRPQTALAAGAHAGAATSITVQAVDKAGVSTPFTQALTVAPATASPTSAALKRVQAVVAKTPVYVCGRSQDFGAATAGLLARKDTGALARILSELCQDQTIAVEKVIVSGCFRPLLSAAQIPAAEQGGLQQLIDIAKLPTIADVNAGKDAPAGIYVERALRLGNGVISSGPVLVDGVQVSPRNAGRFVYLPEIHRIFSSDATVSVAGIRLKTPRTSFDLSTNGGSGGRIYLGTFPWLPGGRSTVAGFDISGDVSVTLTPGGGVVPGGAELRIPLRLPAFLSLVPGVGDLKPVTAHLSSAGALVLDDLKIGPTDVGLAPGLGVSNLQLSYTDATGEWQGGGDVCVEAVGACLRASPGNGLAPPGGVVIRDGRLVRLFARVDFNPSIPLFPGLQLNNIGAGVGLDPTRLLGSANLTAAGIFDIDGTLAIAFPSSAAPYVLTKTENGSAFPDAFYQRRYTTATLAIGADGYLKVPLIDARVKLGGAYLLYSAPGYVAFGGGINFDFLGIVSISGHADGEFNFANARFNMGVGARVCVVDLICAGADANVSDQGAGACVKLDAFVADVNIGGGVVFNPYRVVIWPFDGCRWTRFADLHVFGARIAQAGAPLKLTVKDGDPSLAIKLDGTSGAPRVRVTAPDGRTYESTDGPGAAVTPAVRILRSEQLKSTMVGLEHPKPGDYTIETLPDSAAITATSEAVDPPPASVSADVSAAAPLAAAVAHGTEAAIAAAKAGAKRTLTYDVRRRPGQKVTFVEVGLGGRRTIGTTSGGRGRLTFTPAPGRDPRRIEAQFTLDGLPAETRTIVRFTPPSDRLAAPSALRVRRRGAALQVSWPRVAGATGYDVVVTAASGEQRRRHTAAAAITLIGVPRSSGGTVVVRGTAPLRRGALRTARFRPNGRRAPTRFAPLPKLRRS